MKTELLKKLRSKTGASFLLCREALNHTDNNLEEAIKYIDTHQKKEDGNQRVASKGMVVVTYKDNDAILFEVNAETDFITTNKYFTDFISSIKEPLLNSEVTNPIDALSVKLPNGKTIEESLTYIAGLTKENLKLRRFYRVRKADIQSFGTYTHQKGRIASLVVINQRNQDISNALAMQVVAQNAQYLSYDQIDQDTLNYEKFLYEKEHQAFNETDFIEQLKAKSLLDQKYFKNPEITVEDLLESNELSLIDFYKFELGQGIDNKLNCRLDIPCDGSKITVTPITN